jgi:hypothetical protein
MVSIDGTTALLAVANVQLAPFSASPLDQISNVKFQHDDKLTLAFDATIKAAGLDDPHYAFALVDLTDDPTHTPGFGSGKPAYAGYRDTDYDTIASLAKLLALYGAYQLRFDLQKYVKNSGQDPTAPGNANGIRGDYKARGITEKAQDIPRIEDIFVVTGTGKTATLDFARNRTIDAVNLAAVHGASNPDPKNPGPRWTAAVGKLRNVDNLITYTAERPTALADQPPAKRTLWFYEHIRLMTGWSDDVSAGVVIEALGFPYLWQLANYSHLFQPSWPRIGDQKNSDGGQGGLFLARDYCGVDWASRLAGWNPPPIDTPGPLQGGTARSVAVLMTALAQGRLVGDGIGDFDAAGHAEIYELLRFDKQFQRMPNKGEGSPIGIGIAQATNNVTPAWSFDQSHFGEFAVSKIGWLPHTPAQGNKAARGHLSNAVFVKATRGNSAPPIAAVLVGINQRKDQTDSQLEDTLTTFGKEATKLLMARHPTS